MTTKDATSPKVSSGDSPGYYWVIMSTGFVMVLAGMGFGRYAYPMLLPSMQDGLQVTYGPMGVLGTANLVGYLVSSLVGGVLASRYGGKMVATAALGLAGLAMLALGLAPAYWVAFMSMLLVGIGTGSVFTPAAGLGRAWAPPNMAGFTMGLINTGVAAGMVIAAFFIPIILTSQGAAGWRTAWVYMGVAALALTPIALVTLKEKTSGGPGGGPGAAPVLAWGKVFRNPAIAGLALVYFLHGFYAIYGTFFVAYMRRALSFPTEQAGNIWFYSVFMGLLFMLFWGWLSDRIGRKQAMAPCVVLLAAGILMPMFWQDIPVLYLSAMLFGACFAGPIAIILAAACDSVPGPLAAAAMGLVTAAFGLGQAVSPAAAGFLIDLTGSFYPGFTLSAAVVGLSLVTFLLLPLKKPVA